VEIIYALHPDFLRLLFPPSTCKPIMFHANETLNLRYFQLYQPLSQNICARNLFIYLFHTSKSV
jgi:hypothetical protein